MSKVAGAKGDVIPPKNGLPSVVKLGAEWCPPCRAMKPVLEELTAELKGKVNVLDLDIEKNRALARQYKVSLIPTIIIFDRKGKAKTIVTGFIDKDDLRRKLKEFGLL
jgi:thioredoxin 1